MRENRKRCVVYIPYINPHIIPYTKSPLYNVYYIISIEGKTTILYRLKTKKTVNTLPTIGFNVETVTPCKGMEFTVWDVGGQDKFRPLWGHYLEDTKGLFFVMDSCDKERLFEARNELSGILESDKMKGVPVVILANKQDIPTYYTREITEEIQSDLDYVLTTSDGHAGTAFSDLTGTSSLTPTEIAEALNLTVLLEGRKWTIESTCALKGDGLIEAMEKMGRLIKERRKEIFLYEMLPYARRILWKQSQFFSMKCSLTQGEYCGNRARVLIGHRDIFSHIICIVLLFCPSRVFCLAKR
ncbi:hypothetical protein KUTeg_013689 [Tegillarca granosa]|uniref:Uncharacterized protein n=1 Tax=Tegillarca granosa TaxID=220873 RepID=A0ABQ9EYA0_TEGGR|nr:hypothetical protein KUTeg_013689 [Tegillarca granosa]